MEFFSSCAILFVCIVSLRVILCACVCDSVLVDVYIHNACVKNVLTHYW